ncbi:MAG: hypothetical protein AB7S41_15005 [Parvibaculaceae bacterium]
MLSFLGSAAISLAILVALSLAAGRFILRHSKEDLKPAAWKAFFLWLVSTSPVLVSIALSSPVAGKGEVWRQFLNKILEKLTLTEMFVYSAAFLAPVLYVVFDVFRAYKDNEIQLTLRELSSQMRGMEGVFLTSVVILILTLIAYAGANTNNSVFSGTYLALFLQEKGYVLYLSSLLIWYSVILWEKRSHFSFEKSEKADERHFTEGYAQRRGTEQ